MDSQLRTWNSTQIDNRGHRYDVEWGKRPSSLILRLAGTDLARAEARALKALHVAGKTRTATHDDIIAQTSLGTWRYLLPSHSDAGKAVLWRDSIRYAFPNLGRPVDRLVDSVESVYRLRNRIAHLEPIFGLNLEARRRNMQTVLEDIDASTAQWFVSGSPIPSILARRPNVSAGR